MYKLIFNTGVWIKTLAYILDNEGTYTQQITRDLVITYTHMSKIITGFEKFNLIETTRIKETKFGNSNHKTRTKKIKLTKEGIELAILCRDILFKLKRIQ